MTKKSIKNSQTNICLTLAAAPQPYPYELPPSPTQFFTDPSTSFDESWLQATPGEQVHEAIFVEDLPSQLDKKAFLLEKNNLAVIQPPKEACLHIQDLLPQASAVDEKLIPTRRYIKYDFASYLLPEKIANGATFCLKEEVNGKKFIEFEGFIWPDSADSSSKLPLHRMQDRWHKSKPPYDNRALLKAITFRYEGHGRYAKFFLIAKTDIKSIADIPQAQFFAFIDVLVYLSTSINIRKKNPHEYAMLKKAYEAYLTSIWNKMVVSNAAPAPQASSLAKIPSAFFVPKITEDKKSNQPTANQRITRSMS